MLEAQGGAVLSLKSILLRQPPSPEELWRSGKHFLLRQVRYGGLVGGQEVGNRGDEHRTLNLEPSSAEPLEGRP